MTHKQAGFVRFRGRDDDLYLVGPDLIIEVRQADGTWIPLRGVCSADIRMRANEIVTATMEVEICGIDAGAINAVAWSDPRTRWQRFRLWLARG